MFIQKILHVHHPLSETKARLAKVGTLSRHMEGVHKAVITADGVGQFACELPGGLHAHCVVVELPTDNENQVLFKSTTGNLTVAGLIEFIQVKENLTEVQVTIEYGFASLVAKIADHFVRSMDRFFQSQLRVLQVQLERPHTLPSRGEVSRESAAVVR